MSPAEPPAPQHKRLARAAVGGNKRPERNFPGIAVSPGVAIGPVFGASEPVPEITRHKIQAADIAGEGARVEAAIAQSRQQLGKLRARLAILPEESQAEIAPLIDAYIRMLGPSRLIRGVRRRIEETLLSAESAVVAESDAIAEAILAQAEPGMAAEDRVGLERRAEEIREIARRLVRNLTRAPFKSFAGLPDGAVLISESLRPSDAALLDPSRLAGVAAEEGGADGHTAVMLRALGVPAVLGAVGVAHAIRPGDIAVVDGGAGTVALNPSSETLTAARRAVAAFARERQRYARLRRLPAETTDGEAVELQANLELPLELPLIAQSGAVGIGLLRTEFLFMNRETMPDEATQAESYRAIVEAMNGDPVTFRVLDWGGEKDIEALASAGVVPDVADPNPALGMRGIRLLLRRPELLETQFAAILRAGVAGPVRVMLPMVTTVGEVRASREVYERVGRRLRRRGERIPEKLPPLGIMIETPGAALSADALALEADFFAIGTNDLTAYTLAVDRAETDLAALYDPLHPAVLRLVQFATEAALRMRMPVSVCGEMAADPRLTPLLLGLGVRSFSMNAGAVPRVKQRVRAVAIDDCARFARRVMEQADPAR
ncbi:MAG TPA: phosphoenolpyruvate--protein phosphotransferase, partial [Acetobacteraceae bacterium]|nr:phosphoenolpyruvate--protein phosphotransferase [Acetobacteraceae bacterium]